jgi:hypothetical protein
MGIGIWFWLIYVLALVFGIFGWRAAPDNHWTPGYSFVVWVLIGLLGWHAFGAPLK